MAVLSFPPIYIEQEVAKGRTQYTRRVDIYEADNVTLWKRGAPLRSGNVNFDLGGTHRRSGSIVLHNIDGELDLNRNGGFWYDKVIRPIFGVVSDSGSWERTLGSFVIADFSRKDVSRDVGVSIRDFSSKLDYQIPLTIAFPDNHPLEDVISEMAVGGGLLLSQVSLPTTSIAIEGALEFKSKTNRWKAMSDLAEAHNYDLFFDDFGILNMEVFADPAVDVPQYKFRAGLGSNVASMGMKVSPDLIRNHIVVVGETISGSPVWGEAFNNEPNSPTRIDLLGSRTERIDSALVTNFQQAVDMAERILKFKSLERFSYDLGIILIPWLDVNVTVDFEDPNGGAGDPTRWLINKFTVPLDLKPLTAVLARVTNVINEVVPYPGLDVWPDVTLYPGSP